MDLEMYKDLLEKQKNAMTPECKEAIIEQIRLHEIAVEKQRVKDELYEKWYRLFVSGCGKLLEQFPEISNKLTDSEIKAEALKEIIFHAQNKTAEYQDVINKMKSIPELSESSSLNVPLGKAYYEFFSAFRSEAESRCLVVFDPERTPFRGVFCPKPALWFVTEK